MAKATAVAEESGKRTLSPGMGSKRSETRFVVVYGAPKCRKTTSASTLPKRTKWIVSDSNCVPTLKALGRMPSDPDIYEVVGLTGDPRSGSLGAHDLVEEMIAAATDGNMVDVPAVVIDSVTALCDWHQQDVAKATSQRYMGENPKNNGWQQFNSEFGAFIDAVAELSRHVTVVMIAHAKEKADAAKGDWNGLNLPPQMALKLGRSANWVLFQSISSGAVTEGTVEDDFTQIVTTGRGEKRAITVTIYTANVGLWIAGVNAVQLGPEEPADLLKLFQKEGLPLGAVSAADGGAKRKGKK